MQKNKELTCNLGLLSDEELTILTAIVLLVFTKGQKEERHVGLIREFAEELYPIRFQTEFDVRGNIVNFFRLTSPLDIMFEDLAKENPQHEAVKLYKQYIEIVATLTDSVGNKNAEKGA